MPRRETVTIQIQIDTTIGPKNKIIINDDMYAIQSKMYKLCSELEQYGFVRAELYENGQVYLAPDWGDKATI
jgi:hypothetical protein